MTFKKRGARGATGLYATPYRSRVCRYQKFACEARGRIDSSRVEALTRFNIGTAASAVTAAAAPLGLTDTGADSAAEWSPEHIGEPEEDFPLFTIIRDVIFRPIGLARAQPLPGDRATFYVPRSDDHPGRDDD